jgi:uncharacterized protein
MKDGIPARVKASAAVARGSSWSGSIPIASLPRLAAALCAADGALQVELAVGQDVGGVSMLRGSIRGELPLECQHCLQTFSWPLQISVELRLVGSEAEERRLLHDCDPLLVEDDNLALPAVVEEEALLAIPIAPRCGACNA